jgi:hypothetical protein
MVLCLFLADVILPAYLIVCLHKRAIVLVLLFIEVKYERS